MAYPIIVCNTASGSDTNSGAGPGNGFFSGSPVTGTFAANTAVTTLSCQGAPDLSSILTDGSQTVYIAGLGIQRILGVNNTTKTITVETAATTSAGTAFTIGGKLGSINGTNARKLFAATAGPSTNFGATGQWILSLEDDQSINSTITLAFSAGTGTLIIRANPPVGTRIAITQTANATHFTGNTANRIKFENIEFTNSNATKNYVVTSSTSTVISFERCIVGAENGTNCPNGVVTRSAGTPVVLFFNSLAIRVGANGFNGPMDLRIDHSEISRATTNGINNSTGTLIVTNSIITHAGTDGINCTATTVLIANSTIANNGGDGLDLSVAQSQNMVRVYNCILSNNANYGLRLGTAPNYAIIRGNAFFTNTSGNALNISLDSSNIIDTDPQFVNTTNTVRNYKIGANLKGKGYPDGTNIGGSSLGTRTFNDPGAAQREETGGSTLIIIEGD